MPTRACEGPKGRGLVPKRAGKGAGGLGPMTHLSQLTCNKTRHGVQRLLELARITAACLRKVRPAASASTGDTGDLFFEIAGVQPALDQIP